VSKSISEQVKASSSPDSEDDDERAALRSSWVKSVALIFWLMAASLEDDDVVEDSLLLLPFRRFTSSTVRPNVGVDLMPSVLMGCRKWLPGRELGIFGCS
jgi:hypothetical protein